MIDQIKVEEALEKVRKGLKSENGDIELVKIDNDIIYVKLKGACGSCPMSILTLKNWVEATLKEEIPNIKSVRSI